MIDEHSRRRPEFEAGTVVRLADGQDWSLPMPMSGRFGPSLVALLDGCREAEDLAESLRAGLALTIHLLTRNYDLAPGEIESLLTFPPGSAELRALQGEVHRVAEALARSLVAEAAASIPEGAAPGRRAWSLRSLWTW